MIPRSAGDPGLGVAGQLADVLGQAAGGHVGQRDLLDDRPEVRPHGDPHLDERLGRPVVGHVLGPAAAHGGQRALDGADDVGHGDLLGPAVEPVAAVRAALAAHQAGLAQVAEDVLEELQRDALRLRDRVALRRAVGGRRELDRRADGVVRLRRDAHAGILPKAGRPPRRGSAGGAGVAGGLSGLALRAARGVRGGRLAGAALRALLLALAGALTLGVLFRVLVAHALLAGVLAGERLVLALVHARDLPRAPRGYSPAQQRGEAAAPGRRLACDGVRVSA